MLLGNNTRNKKELWNSWNYHSSLVTIQLLCLCLQRIAVLLLSVSIHFPGLTPYYFHDTFCNLHPNMSLPLQKPRIRERKRNIIFWHILKCQRFDAWNDICSTLNTALPCVASNILDFPVGKQHLYSAVWWGLENKDWSLLCILSLSLSLKWIPLTSTFWGFLCQEALSYSCSTMPLPESKFNWIAGRESALQAGSGPYTEVHPTTKHYHNFFPLRHKKYNIYSPMTQNDYTTSALGCKLCWSNRIDSSFYFGVDIFDIQKSHFAAYVL